MIPLYLPDDVRGMDQRAFSRGVDPAALMDDAARHLARGVLDLADHRGLSRYGLCVLLVCGKGNNGGDGLAAARHLLARGVDARSVVVDPVGSLSADSLRELGSLRALGGRVVMVDQSADEGDRLAATLGPLLDRADIVVDCLLGTGAAGEPRGTAATVIPLLNAFAETGGAVVACDLPSGVDAATGRIPGTAVAADLTVTLGAHKRGLWLHPASTHVGHLVLGEIGVIDGQDTPCAHVLEAPDLAALAPPPGERSHKRSRGVVVIYAGSPDMAGAALLSARGALGAGAGLVTIATPSSAAHRIAGQVPEAMLLPLPDDADGIVEAISQAAERADVLAIGPGLGLADHTQAAVRRLVTDAPAAIVLDADGINAFRDHVDELVVDERPADRPLVMTPQAQEMGRLAGLSGHGVQARRAEVAVEQAARFQATMVAKGPRSVIAAPDGRVWINPTGGPALATGGTGDVLTGITAALVAQSPAPSSVAAAVYLHGLAGDLAADNLTARATAAGDVADHLPAACRKLGL